VSDMTNGSVSDWIKDKCQRGSFWYSLRCIWMMISPTIHPLVSLDEYVEALPLIDSWDACSIKCLVAEGTLLLIYVPLFLNLSNRFEKEGSN
jgi:hypothetical protein